MKRDYKISVAMATYNGEKYIDEQITSILSQLEENDELVISDDGSKDKTLQIIKNKATNDKRIKIYHNSKEHGYTSNFENALSHVTGDFIFLSDQDDIWLENKVATVISYLETQEYDFVIHDCIIVNENKELLFDSYFKKINVKSGFINQMIRMRYLGCCMAFNNKILKAMLPFPKNKYYVEHDTWIASFCELYFKVKRLEEPLIYYRRHGQNVSDGGEGKGYSTKTKVIRRIYRLFYLIKYFPKIINERRGK